VPPVVDDDGIAAMRESGLLSRVERIPPEAAPGPAVTHLPRRLAAPQPTAPAASPPRTDDHDLVTAVPGRSSARPTATPSPPGPVLPPLAPTPPIPPRTPTPHPSVATVPAPAPAPSTPWPTPPRLEAPAATRHLETTDDQGGDAALDALDATVLRPRSYGLQGQDGGVSPVTSAGIVVGRRPAGGRSSTALRASGAVLSLDDPTRRSSREHAHVWADDAGAVWADDLHSANGTTVEPRGGGSIALEPGRPHRLASGDALVVGDHRLTVVRLPAGTV